MQAFSSSHGLEDLQSALAGAIPDTLRGSLSDGRTSQSPNANRSRPLVDPALSGPPSTGWPWSSMPAPGSQQQPAGRLLTIFMEDLRTAKPDLTMAEVVVDMQPDGDGGWMVDGDAVFQRLQASPGRIDGDAKVSVRRGKYKQCVYRLGDDAGAPTIACMMRVSHERKLDVVIEPLLQSQPAAQKPAAQKSLPKRTFDEMNASEATLSTSPTRPPPSTVRPPAIQSAAIRPEARARPVAAEPADPAKRGKAAMNAVIVEWIRAQIQHEAGVGELIQSKGRVLPMLDLLRTYRVAQKFVNMFNDTRTPADLVGAPDRKISKTNVLTALGRQTSWGNDMETTLTLVDLYGPGMPREDPTVVAIVNGQGDGSDKEGSVHFLNTLRRVDQEWNARHGVNQAPFPTVASRRRARKKAVEDNS